MMRYDKKKQEDQGKNFRYKSAQNQTKLQEKAHEFVKHATSSSRDTSTDNKPSAIQGNSSREGGRNRGLVRLADRQGKNLRANGSSAPSRVNSPSLSARHESVYYDSHGNGSTRSAVATRHPSLASFRKAVAKSVPLAMSGQTHGSRYHEYEYLQGADRHTLITGREFLCVVNAGVPVGIGDRVDSGLAILDPRGIGGRLKYFADAYAQHKFIRLTICYEPSCAATTPGAIALYFAPDPGELTIETGTDLVQHASTFPNFIQTLVWEEAVLEVKPEDAMLRYFDSSNGEFREETQGIITIMAASALAAGSYGTLYIDYEVDFFSAELDFSLTFRQAATMILDWTTACVSVEQGDGVMTTNLVPGPNYGRFVSSLPTGVPSADGLVDYMFYGTVQSLTITLGAAFNWSVLGDPTARSFQTGQAFWGRFSYSRLALATATYFILFPSLQAASSDEGTLAQQVTDTSLHYSADYAFTGTHTVTMLGWWYPLG